jgi:hypothetical protein
MILYLLTIWFAYAESIKDHRLIGQGVSIDHIRSWVARAVQVGLVGIVCWGLLDGDWSDIVGAAFLFASIHRFKLNKLRGLDWFYVSRSNKYDTLFLTIFSGNVKRAGTAMYVIELVMAVLLLLK